MKKILVVFGTRAEWLKLYPIYYEWNYYRFRYGNLDLKFYWTHQHERSYFDHLHYDYESPITEPVTTSVGQIFSDLDKHLEDHDYDLIMVQGDTFSTLAGAFLGFAKGIPVIHIEAGLRTYRKNPFPEEQIRVFVDQISQYRFCPTMIAAANLNREDSFFLKGELRRTLMVGNTIVDMVKLTLDNLKRTAEQAGITEPFFLCSLHRRESWSLFGSMLDRLKKRAEELKTKFLFVFHPNNKLEEAFKSIESKWVKAVFPQSHLNLIFLMRNCLAVVTDSGGMIEEAAVLKKPCFILREETERQESLSLGLAKLIGREEGVKSIDTDFSWFQKDVFCPYGDGTASLQILRYLNRNI